MKTVFADTLYWYGLANPRDTWHSPVLQARATLGEVHLLTTQEVLTEFLAAMSGGGAHWRQVAVALVATFASDASVTVLPQSSLSFAQGVELYGQRLDKAYSLVDCISMNSMRKAGITEVLTNDHHFTQEGFRILITR